MECNKVRFTSCYDLPVRLPYIVVTCARMFRIKRVCCDPPCRLGVLSDIQSVHDTSVKGKFACIQPITYFNEFDINNCFKILKIFV